MIPPVDGRNVSIGALKVEVMGYDDKDEAKLIARVHTRWASRSYKQGYNSYKYGYKPVTHF